ncbi:hypothetical protein DYB32_000847 [Aphanomyces invadans]|uniref:GH18 domain-containing protein n=1 Tax=Aphanomyces invadans TaxID=157072 RepID=A0A418B8R1_9STRA|nr:hypothetical protein DYB32_000847 [Aphanomyces invadans]
MFGTEPARVTQVNGDYDDDDMVMYPRDIDESFPTYSILVPAQDASTRYVTHVIWSFAEPLEDGTIKTKLQFWDDEHIRDCIGQLRMRCIKSMIAVGGASFRERFLGLKKPENLARFKASAIKLVQLYPTCFKRYHGQMNGPGLDTAQRPGEPRYLLSWDEFPYAWDPPKPDDSNYKGCIRYTEGEDGWHRCFEPRISSIVDFVNVMFYNINGGDVRHPRREQFETLTDVCD